MGQIQILSPSMARHLYTLHFIGPYWRIKIPLIIEQIQIYSPRIVKIRYTLYGGLRIKIVRKMTIAGLNMY
jgi:hypothetical protein